MLKQQDGECCICLESVSTPDNLLVKLPCSCKLWIHQKCFVQANRCKCLVCKKKYNLDNFSESLKIYLHNSNLLENILSNSDSDEKSEDEIYFDDQYHIDLEILDEDSLDYDRESSCVNFIISIFLKVLFIYLLGLLFGLIYCVINQYTYPQLIWYLHILANLITGSITFCVLYYCCRQISYSLRN